MNYLGNAFSLQMLTTLPCQPQISEVSLDEVKSADFVSCIGHADTAAVVSGLLEKPVPCNRVSVALNPGDTLYVAQVTGGRLPEGCTNLPEGFALKFLKVSV